MSMNSERPEKALEDGTSSQNQETETTTVSSSSSRRSRKSAGAFRTISEVADELDVQQHVLRFWETKFNQVKPLKRGGGRRYYRPEDVSLLKKIHHLLYTEGYTIKGVQKMFKGQGIQQIIAEEQEENTVSPANESALQVKAQQPTGMSDKQKSILQAMLGDLKELRDMLKGEE